MTTGTQKEPPLSPNPPRESSEITTDSRLSPFSTAASAFDQEKAIRSEEHATVLRRMQLALPIAFGSWLLFSGADWVLAQVVGHGQLLSLFQIRFAIAVVIFVMIIRVHINPAPSIRSMYRMAAMLLGAASLAVSVMAIDFGGIVSPYANGISLVLVAEGVMMPKPWQRSVFPTVVAVLSYPLIMIAVTPVFPDVAQQWSDEYSRVLFTLNMLFVATTGVFTVSGAHVSWALRQKIFESRTLGRYRLKNKLGSGGMGEVWRAYHFGLRRDVALKILRPQAGKEQLAITRFEREVVAMTELAHPNAVRVYDFGVTPDGLWYYVMELLQGADMGATVWNEGPMAPARAVTLCLQACGALAEAHAKGIVHRDIKPENIFITALPNGQEFAKVLDFGIARIDTEGNENITREGWVGGTPAYISPEVAIGRGATFASDVYSVGCVLYFTLTGKHVFQGENSLMTLHKHVNEFPVPPSAHTTTPIPKDLETIIMKCLEKLPADRYVSAVELVSALANLPPLPTHPLVERAMPKTSAKPPHRSSIEEDPTMTADKFREA